MAYRGFAWHRTKGVINAVFPCGVIAWVEEMFHHESRVQICSVLQLLREASDGKIKNFGYDDACHLWESIDKAAASGCREAAKVLEECDFFIDPWHLKGHKRAMCHEKFNPEDRPYGKQHNAMAGEQCWRYLNKHRHCLRYLDGPRFKLHLLWVALSRNDLVLCAQWDK